MKRRRIRPVNMVNMVRGPSAKGSSLHAAPFRTVRSWYLDYSAHIWATFSVVTLNTGSVVGSTVKLVDSKGIGKNL